MDRRGIKGGGSIARREKRSSQVLDNIRHARHLEAYAVFLITVSLTVLGLAGVVGTTVMLSAILAALSLLVAHTTVRDGDRKQGLNGMLGQRHDLGPFEKRLPGVRDLRLYGPTAANVLMHADDIREHVLHKGGKVHFLVMEDSSPAQELAAIQLDGTIKVKHNLSNSLNILHSLQGESGFSCRQLPMNPGFGLLIVDPKDRNGYVVYESHGFKDDNIAKRMHIIIRREESPYWFEYWVDRYEAMWKTAKPLPR